MVYSSLCFFIFPPRLPPPTPFKLLQLPDLAFTEVLRSMSLSSLIQLSLTSQTAARKVVTNIGQTRRPLEIHFAQNWFCVRIIEQLGEKITIELELVDPTRQSMFSMLRGFLSSHQEFGSSGLPIQYSERKWIVSCDNMENGLNAIFKLFFVSRAFLWSLAHFEHPWWLTTNRFLHLTHCQKITVLRAYIDDDGLNRFLRKWQLVESTVQTANFERSRRWRHYQPIRFERIIEGLNTQPLAIPEDDSSLIGVIEGEYVAIRSADSSKCAILYKRDDMIHLKLPQEFVPAN